LINVYFTISCVGLTQYAQYAIKLPGFYDGIVEPEKSLLAQWEALGFDEAGFFGNIGLNNSSGEPGRQLLEQLWARPSCDINGIWGGYTEPGFKTVIPAQASAKVSFRLVAGQDPENSDRRLDRVREMAGSAQCQSIDSQGRGFATP
jgi:acetylornithine deacetylase/succinyl-diaminopimelate desuccinylase-like protein